jgi:hypothetical protein
VSGATIGATAKVCAANGKARKRSENRQLLFAKAVRAENALQRIAVSTWVWMVQEENDAMNEFFTLTQRFDFHALRWDYSQSTNPPNSCDSRHCGRKVLHNSFHSFSKIGDF